MTDPAPATRRSNPALLQRRIRDLHRWIGLLIAPSVMFFALTGSVQLFGLHEAKREVGYTPPALIERLAAAHKNQVFSLPRRRPPGPGRSAGTASPGAAPPGAARAGAKGPAEEARLSVYLLKWVFLLVALGLTVSTGMGVWLGLKFSRNRRLAWGLLIAGALIPVLLLAL